MKGIKEIKIEDLKKALKEKQDSLRSFKFGNFGGKTKNVKEGLHLRKEIAQILTELNARKA